MGSIVQDIEPSSRPARPPPPPILSLISLCGPCPFPPSPNPLPTKSHTAHSTWIANGPPTNARVASTKLKSLCHSRVLTGPLSRLSWLNPTPTPCKSLLLSIPHSAYPIQSDVPLRFCPLEPTPRTIPNGIRNGRIASALTLRISDVTAWQSPPPPRPTPRRSNERHTEKLQILRAMDFCFRLWHRGLGQPRTQKKNWRWSRGPGPHVIVWYGAYEANMCLPVLQRAPGVAYRTAGHFVSWGCSTATVMDRTILISLGSVLSVQALLTFPQRSTSPPPPLLQ